MTFGEHHRHMNDNKIAMQAFVPSEIHDHINRSIFLLDKEYEGIEKRGANINSVLKIRKNICKNTSKYLKNLVTERELKSFYIENSVDDFTKPNLIDCVIEHFESLSEWDEKIKNTSKKEMKISADFIKHLKHACNTLKESPELENHLGHQISYDFAKSFSDEDNYYSDLAADAIFDPVFDKNKRPRIMVEELLNSLMSKTTQFSNENSGKKNIVSRLEDKSAPLFYSVRELKRIFKKCNVPSAKHKRYIILLINSVMEESIDEDRVYGILRQPSWK